jgi:tetratricopeptide (TPR) repeat protein
MTHGMKRTGSLVASIVAALTLGAGASAPAWSADKPAKDDKAAAAKQGVSRAIAKDAMEAQKLVSEKKYPEAIAKLNELEAKSGKTPYDDYIVNDMLAFAKMNTQDYTDAAVRFEKSVTSEFIKPEDMAGRLKVLATLNYQIKNYEKAVQYGQKALEADPNEESMATITGQGLYLTKDYPGTVKFMNAQIEKDLAAGRTPKEPSLLLLRSACVNLDDAACTDKATEQLVKYTPQPKYWRELLDPVFRSKGQSDGTLIFAFRLKDATDAMETADDYLEYADIALRLGSPGEAQRIIEKGIQKNALTAANASKQLDSAKRQAETDKAGLEKVAKDAAANAAGQRDAGVGLAYYGYQQYDKAVEALQRGLGKPGVKNPAEARLLLGVSQLAAGKKDEALASFKEVKGDAQFEKLANLWALHAGSGSGTRT